MTSYLSFVTASHDVTTAYVGHHLTSLVILSLSMAILAALASFYHTNLIKRSQVQWHRFAWHLSGALTMGIGVWAMHFIGMISFRIDVPIYYSIPITAVSVLPAIVAAWITLWVLRKDHQTLKTIAIGGLFMGAGIGAMHYTGMAAMQADADIRYLPGMFVLSVFVAVLLAALSLGARTWLAPIVKNDNRRTLVSAVIMGIAVSSMHYTAMHATVFLPVETGIGAHTGLDAGQLLVSTIIVTVFLVVLSTTIVILVSKQLGLRQSARQRAKEVRALSERLRKITERVPGMVFQLRRDPTGYLQFSYLSQASERLFGIPPHEAMEEPKKVLSLVPAKERLKIVETLAESAATMSPWNHEFPVHTPSGEARWMASNAMPQQERNGVVSWSGFLSDVTEKRAQEQIIHQMAFYDGLTGLPNRKFVVRQLAELLARKDERRPTVIALLVNLDGFKRINDVHGQAVGDAVLHTCAERLRELTSGDMQLARLTADEFLVISKADTAYVAGEMGTLIGNAILRSLAKPMRLSQVRYQGTASIGMALADGKCTGGQPAADQCTNQRPEELIRQADLAVNLAKEQGGNRLVRYCPEIEASLSAQYALEADMREALGTNQFVLYFQPQVNQQGKSIGAEALIRWKHPEKGMISPADFIPLAERSGLIIPLGNWVLEASCRQLAIWQKETSLHAFTLSINVSANQFYQQDFTEIVLHTIQKNGLPPHCIKLELTESLVLEDIDEAIHKMKVLRGAGVRFSMDDFGTGYSSLSYLSLLPFDEVKIDQAFIRRAVMVDHERDWAIVEAILQIAKRLEMGVVAEGVETEMQLSRLQSIACEFYQGYFFSKPVPAEEFLEVVMGTRPTVLSNRLPDTA